MNQKLEQYLKPCEVDVSKRPSPNLAIIKLTAERLMRINGCTSSLEVKNDLRGQGFYATQSMISAYLDSCFTIYPEWDFLMSDSGEYREYFCLSFALPPLLKGDDISIADNMESAAEKIRKALTPAKKKKKKNKKKKKQYGRKLKDVFLKRKGNSYFASQTLTSPEFDKGDKLFSIFYNEAGGPPTIYTRRFLFSGKELKRKHAKKMFLEFYSDQKLNPDLVCVARKVK